MAFRRQASSHSVVVQAMKVIDVVRLDTKLGVDQCREARWFLVGVRNEIQYDENWSPSTICDETLNHWAFRASYGNVEAAGEKKRCRLLLPLSIMLELSMHARCDELERVGAVLLGGKEYCADLSGLE